ncbi:MAG: EAL domain-containing protein [Chloroflexi bacterium]|nr:EAL domain-containing protein [Chloroflexota bacterium]
MSQPHPISILIVDDEPRNLIALEAALGTIDCRRVTASSGREALLCLLTQDFAAIVLDIHMPEMDGFETASLIRARESSQSTPIIFLTADDRVGSRVLEGYRLGAVDYLHKPFNPEILRSKVAVFVELFRKTAALEERTAELITTTLQLDRARAAADLRHQALHDGLTGLPNRVLLYERLESLINASGSDGEECALLLLDLDRFKEVNDTLGHQVGDGLLRQLGQRLHDAVPVTDMVARLGGDEFALILPHSDRARAAQVAEHLARLLQTPFVLEGQSIAMEASIGIAVAPQHGEDADSLLRRADVAMYQAKRRGTGVAIYTHDEDAHRPDRLALLGELRKAIEHDELLLHYQPILDLREGTVVGVEALVRWQHPQRGLVPPSEFIPLAELSGLINPLSHWVLEAAVRQQRAWRALGMDFPVSVNVSRRMLHDRQLPETVAQLLADAEVPPSSLVLEITESSLMADPERADETLKQLRVLGVCMSIDDFGTGYSSLASLKNLVVDELKIDQSFVHAMADDASARAIVRAIIDLADALKLRVVAEGVEDRATWDVLVGLGCDVAQGYLLSPPLAALQLEEWMRTEAPLWLEVAASPQAEDPLKERIRGRGARLTAEEEFIARKHAETALLASEERNRLALQAAGMGTWDREMVHDVLTWSPETEALHGLAPGTFDGTTAAFQNTIHPEDWPALVEEMRASAVEHRETIARFRTVWPNGSVHWIEAKGRGRYAIDGTLERINGTSIDITERKLAEEALRASEERFRKQYKGNPLPTYSWLSIANDFVLEDYNDAAEDIVGDGIRNWVGVRASVRYADDPEILVDLHRCITEQHTLRREMNYRYPDTGRERNLAVTYVFVPPLTVMILTEDITDARHAENSA